MGLKLYGDDSFDFRRVKMLLNFGYMFGLSMGYQHGIDLSEAQRARMLPKFTFFSLSIE